MATGLPSRKILVLLLCAGFGILVSTVKSEGILSVFGALHQMRAVKSTAIGSIREAINDAIPGVSYPTLAEIPKTSFSCRNFAPGFYADPEAQCQVYRRCSEEDQEVMFSYLCPNKTLFNQVSLNCDWWYNVDCSKATVFYTYSNPRIFSFTDPVSLISIGPATVPITSSVGETEYWPKRFKSLNLKQLF